MPPERSRFAVTTRPAAKLKARNSAEGSKAGPRKCQTIGSAQTPELLVLIYRLFSPMVIWGRGTERLQLIEIY